MAAISGMGGFDLSIERVSAADAARSAYRFLRERFAAALAVLWLPLALGGLSLYVGMMGYLTALLRYLAAPDPAEARFALAFLAGGILVALFFWAIGVSAIADLALGRARGALPIKIGRQELRTYGAYLRFLLLLALLAGGLGFFFSSLGPLLPAPAAAPLIGLIIVVALFWFAVRVGFLIPPIAATPGGTVLRRAWRDSDGSTLRIAGLLILLLIPSILVHGVGEIVLKVLNGQPMALTNNRIADYARFAETGLTGVIVTMVLSSFFTITLLTAGAVAFHRPAPPQH
jgi:hypothetical protein